MIRPVLSLVVLASFALLAAAFAQEVEKDTLGGPVFTPFTQRPELQDVREAQRIVRRHYPPELKQAGIGGAVHVWIFVDTEGRVRKTLIASSSGHPELDRAARAAAREFRFTTARNRDDVVSVWIQIPIRFAVR